MSFTVKCCTVYDIYTASVLLESACLCFTFIFLGSYILYIHLRIHSSVSIFWSFLGIYSSLFIIFPPELPSAIREIVRMVKHLPKFGCVNMLSFIQNVDSEIVLCSSRKVSHWNELQFKSDHTVFQDGSNDITFKPPSATSQTVP